MKPNVSQNIGEHLRLIQATRRKFCFKRRRLAGSGCFENGGGQQAADGEHESLIFCTMDDGSSVSRF
jgi:hypothetical protein